jgi:S1-C subfamily serine protease
LQPGDHIVRIDDTQVGALHTFYQVLWRGSSAEREVTLEIRRGDEAQTLKLRSVDRMKVLRHSQGI